MSSINKRNGTKPKLTDYEIANLRGRAGRLLKDLIGRTFVLDEGAFDKDNNQTELFQEVEKELHSGYGAKYLEHKESIDTCLIENVPPSKNNKEYSFLLTYIRQVILKHKWNAQTRLQSVGIELDDKQFEIVSSALDSLSVPAKICYTNRYWDPLDLNKLYLERNKYKIPKAIANNQIENVLNDVIIKMKNKYPLYSKRYFDVDEKLIKSTCISAKQWVKETSLKDILANSYIDTPDKIEHRIKLLHNDLSFGLPMLLKPLYDMQVPESMFLTFIETGAYNPVSRRMIELNIPRETAIFLSKKYFNNVNAHEVDLEKFIITKLYEIRNELDYWRRIQIEPLL